MTLLVPHYFPEFSTLFSQIFKVGNLLMKHKEIYFIDKHEFCTT
jgi:hypothetical protein